MLLVVYGGHGGDDDYYSYSYSDQEERQQERQHQPTAVARPRLTTLDCRFCVVFGIENFLPILCHSGLLGRHAHAKNTLKEMMAARPLPPLFHGDSWGRPAPDDGSAWNWTWSDWRIHVVMGMVSEHSMQFRR